MRIWSLLLLGLLAFQVRGSSDPSLHNLEGLTRQWIELRGALAEEAQAWTTRKAQWEDEIRRTRHELATLNAALEETRGELSDVDRKQVEVGRRFEQAETTLDQLEQVMEKLLARTSQLRERIPASLQDDVPLTGGTPSQATASGTMRDLLAQLEALEGLPSEFHVGVERISVQGETRRVHVLYCGLTFAWAVSENGDWAGTGVPTGQGWKWTEGGVDPDQVRAARAMAQQQETADYLLLPLQHQQEAP